MDILVLEDEPSRIEWLKNNCGSLKVNWVKNVSQFKSALINSQPKVIIMDHDLGLPQSGYDAVRHIVETKFKTNTPIIVWSLNPVGSHNMHHLLRSNGYTSSILPYGFSCRPIREYLKGL